MFRCRPAILALRIYPLKPLKPLTVMRERLGGQAERFGMGPAIVLGQDLAETAGPVRHGAEADPATGDRKLGNGHREAAGR